jgi:hypothetical protein
MIQINYNFTCSDGNSSGIKTHFVIEQYMESLAELLLLADHHPHLKQQNIRIATSLQLSVPCYVQFGRGGSFRKVRSKDD